MSNMEDNQDPNVKAGYEVGYGKPPTDTQFKAGRSGNPKGRPKGSRSAITILRKALEEKVVVQENGRRRTRSKAEVMCAQLANKAAGGDLSALRLVFGFSGQLDTTVEAVNPDKLADQEMIQQLVKRLKTT
jgi:Family of unknown function (DUF5681)